MNDKLLKFYEDAFGVKKERIEKIVNEFTKKSLERDLNGETDDVIIIKDIYKIGKTEDERLFLAFYMGGARQIILAMDLIESIIPSKELKKKIWNRLSNNVGKPDIDKLVREDKEFAELIKELERRIRGREKNE